MSVQCIGICISAAGALSLARQLETGKQVVDPLKRGYRRLSHGQCAADEYAFACVFLFCFLVRHVRCQGQADVTLVNSREEDVDLVKLYGGYFFEANSYLFSLSFKLH